MLGLLLDGAYLRGAEGISDLIHQADQALYLTKKKAGIEPRACFKTRYNLYRRLLTEDRYTHLTASAFDGLRDTWSRIIFVIS